jgi:hypothetical protein
MDFLNRITNKIPQEVSEEEDSPETRLLDRKNKYRRKTPHFSIRENRRTVLEIEVTGGGKRRSHGQQTGGNPLTRSL